MKINISKVLSLFLFGSFLAATTSQARVTVTETATETRYEIEIEKVSFERVEIENREFQKAKLKGVDGYNGILFREGYPEIPVVRILVNSAPTIQTSKPNMKSAKFLPAPILPAQASLPKIKGATAPFVMNGAIYKSNMSWPKTDYSVTKAGSLRGQEQFMVTLHPFIYSPSMNRYVVQNRFVVVVPKTAKVSKQKSTAAESMVFIVGEKFKESPSLQQYAQLKKSLGYHVDFIEIGSEIQSPDQIRAEIQKLFARSSSRLSHAIIIGDAEDVPGRSSDLIAGVTDHYYRAIDTADYASDINGPDIGVGRISVTNETELATVLEKYTRYQVGVFQTEQWLNGGAFLATDDRYQVAEGSHNYAIEKYTAPAGYSGIFPQPNTAGGDQLYAITHRVPNSTVQEAMRAGRTLINYSGHGATEFWDAPSVTQEDVRAINHEALPFVISNACITGQFTIPESFGETWQRHAQGAIMFWGSMDNTYWDEDDILEKRMYDAIYRDSKLQFSEITDESLRGVWQFYGGEGRSAYYWETYVTFGDPAIRFRTRATQALKIEGPAVVPYGLQEISYRITNENGQPLKNARVALHVAQGSYVRSAITDAEGRAAFHLEESLIPGSTLEVSAVADNARLEKKLLQIISSEDPFLSFQDFRVNDRSDGLVSLGESVQLSFRLRNLGNSGTRGGTAVIKSVEGPAEIVNGLMFFNSIGGNRDAEPTHGGFQLKINSEAAVREGIRLVIHWQTHEGIEGETTQTFHVAKGVLSVSQIDFGDAGRGIRRGQGGELYISVKNTGNETIRGARLIPKAGALLSEIRGEIKIAELAPGAEERISMPLLASVLESAENGSRATFELSGAYDSRAQEVELLSESGFTVGVLERTVIEASGLAIAIPDNGAAVSSSMQLIQNGLITHVGIAIDIAHSYVGDLSVKLRHPDGTEITLHDQDNGGQENLIVQYGLEGQALPALNALIGKAIEGEWKLIVQDHASNDVGTLNAVKLIVQAYQ